MNKFGLFGLFALLAAFYFAPAQAQTSGKIIYTTPSGASWPLWIGVEGGYYKKYGLDLSTKFGRHPAGIAGVISGDAIMTNYGSDSAITAASKSDKLVLIGSPLNVGSFVLMGGKGLKTVKDIEGKRFAIGRVGDPPYHYTLGLLAKLGIDWKNIHWVPAGAPPARAAALVKGQVDASLLTAPSYYRLEKAGFPVLERMSNHRDVVISTYYVVRRELVTSNPKAAEGLIKAHAEAVNRFYTDPAFAMAAMKKYTRNKKPGPLKRVYKEWADGQMLERIPYILKPSLAGVVSRNKNRKRAPKNINFSTMVNNGIVDKLAREGFFEKVYGPSIRAEIKDRRAKAHGFN
ncbi:MAG: ABC transporter substrate-binding protein [Pseudomonadota bacterium]|nr:ABC transporter substrate-binding protein [Pseudomonadota bacterium]